MALITLKNPMAKPRPINYEVRQSDKPFNGKTWRVVGYKDGKREQFWFDNDRDARAKARAINTEIASHGTELALSPTLKAEAIRALEILQPFGVGLIDAARFYSEREKVKSKSKRVDEFLPEYQLEIQAKVATDNLRAGSLKIIKNTFAKFSAKFGDRNLADISTKEIQNWLTGLRDSERSKERHRGYTIQIFNAAKRSELVEKNPAESIPSFRKSNGEEITTISPDDFQKILNAADPETKPLYAIAGLAGIRWEEIEKLNWEDIREDLIVVSARKAKTRSRRTVDIKPVLAKILEPYRGRTGSVLPLNRNGRPSDRRLGDLRRKVAKKVGITKWPKGVLRHSYISYAYALTNDDKYVSAQAGNSAEIVHSNYKALVTKEDAFKWFDEKPGIVK
jgi:integrase